GQSRGGTFSTSGSQSARKGGPVTTIEGLHRVPHPLHVLVRNNDHLAVKCLVLLCARADLALSAPRRWPQGCHWPCPFSSVGVRTKSSWPLLRNTRSPSPFHPSLVTTSGRHDLYCDIDRQDYAALFLAAN